MPKGIKQGAMNKEQLKKVDTQFGTSARFDFDENTWTFLMPERFMAFSGEFAIVDKQVYDEMINSKERAKILTDALQTLRNGLFKDEQAVNDFIDEALNNYFNP